MITKKSLIAFSRHIFNRSRGVRDKRTMHPMREWMLGLLFCALLLVAGSIYASLTFKYFDTKSAEDVEVGAYAVQYNETAVLEALETYRARLEVYEVLPKVPPANLFEESAAASSGRNETPATPLAPEGDLRVE